MIEPGAALASDPQLAVELQRLTLKLAILASRRLNGAAIEPGAGFGLWIGRTEVDTLLVELLCGDHETESGGDDDLECQIEGLDDRIADHRLAPDSDIGPVERVRRVFHLTDDEFTALIACLAPEIDRRYSRLFGYLQDDITKKRPTTGLIGDLLSQRSVASTLLADSPLVQNALLAVASSRDEPVPSLELKVDAPLVAYLLSAHQHSASAVPGVETIALRDVAGGIEDQALVPKLSDSTLLAGTRTVLVFNGYRGAGPRTSALSVAARTRKEALIIDCSRHASNDDPYLAARVFEREATIRDAVLVWDGADVLLGGLESGDWRNAFSRVANVKRQPWIVIGSKVWEAISTTPGIIPVLVPLEPLSPGERERLWTSLLEAHGVGIDTSAIPALTATYRLDADQIERSVRTAIGLSLARGTAPSIDDLREACRLHSSQALSNHAQKLYPAFSWDDIVLPEDQTSQLREICDHFQYRDTVYDNWRFGRKTTRGRGLNVLFAGPSGTGKTMAAEVVANELGLELYRIDLSMVVDKYIGETEKKLDQIFREAESSNAILFFDEADALFGKRSEVRDSHDRYANIEIAYLLQKMEDYDGVVILATNLRNNLDDAFQRRLHIAIDFPIPDEDQRLEIWKRAIPAEAPLGPDANLEALASRYKLTGGNIKNIAVSAAFLAAADGRVLTMQHLLQAARREHQKIGRLIGATDFEDQRQAVTLN